MFEQGRILFLYAESPLHPGTGTALGPVDLPIQRERHTGFPTIQASGIKGVFRDIPRSLRKRFKKIKEDINSTSGDEKEELEKIKTEMQNIIKKLIGKETNEIDNGDLDKLTKYINLVFGSEPKEGHGGYPGAITFTDARTLLFPVRTLKGIFAWITCPMVLRRLERDLNYINNYQLLRPSNNPINLDVLIPSEEKAILPKESSIDIDGNIILEEFSFEVERDMKKKEEASKLAGVLSDTLFPRSSDYQYWRDKMCKDIVILPDDDFSDFVKISTEILARTRIDPEKGTVEKGALWYEEHLPTETVIYTLVLASYPKVAEENEMELRSASDVLKFFESIVSVNSYIQLGGDETVGKGIVRVKLV